VKESTEKMGKEIMERLTEEERRKIKQKKENESQSSRFALPAFDENCCCFSVAIDNWLSYSSNA